MTKLLAISVSALFILTGCTAEPEFSEVSAAIQNSQTMQAEIDATPEVVAETDVNAEGSNSETSSITLEELAEEYPQAWAAELTEITILLAHSESSSDYPMDLASSPNTQLEYSLFVEQRLRNATKLWEPFFDSDIPMRVSIIHPSDKDWFLQRWEQLGKDNSGEYWWGKTIVLGGGGGVGWNDSEQIPNMWLMFSERFKPVNLNRDFFVHEATHFFQILAFGDSLGEQVGSCWIGEGSAEFAGLATKFAGKFGSLEDDLAVTLRDYSRFRDSRAEGIVRRYEEKGISIAEGLAHDILVTQGNDAECSARSGPMLGYYLGMFVAEKFVIDFGLEVLADLFTRLRNQPIQEAFEQAAGQEYEPWVLQVVVPYLEAEFAPDV